MLTEDRVAEPSVANTVLQRRKDFQQPELVGRILNFLGPTLLAANGEEWQRQRRVIAPNLNERISKSVWAESCSQATKMTKYLVKNPGRKTIDGLRNIAINVLGRSSYGQSQEWTPDEPVDTSDVQQELTYFKGISLITLMLLQAAFLPPKIMKLWFMPSALRLLGRGMEALPKLTRDVLDTERRASKEGSEPRNNLLSQMIQLSDESKAGKTGLTLTEEEIHGNLFLFSAAGFDTTANTMAYAVTLLSAYPEWQDWMREDLHGLSDDPSSWVYDEVYPKCPRVLAVMVSFHLSIITYNPITDDLNSFSSSRLSASSRRFCIRIAAHIASSSSPMIAGTIRSPAAWKYMSIKPQYTKTLRSGGPTPTPLGHHDGLMLPAT